MSAIVKSWELIVSVLASFFVIIGGFFLWNTPRVQATSNVLSIAINTNDKLSSIDGLSPGDDVKGLRTPFSKTTYLGKSNNGEKDRFSVDSSIEMQSYQDIDGRWLDCDPLFVLNRGEEGNYYESIGTPYIIIVDEHLNRTIYPDHRDKSRYIYISCPAFLEGLPFIVTATSISIEGNGFIASFGISNQRTSFTMEFNPDFDIKAFNKIIFELEVVGYDVYELLTTKEGVGIPSPIMFEKVDYLNLNIIDLHWEWDGKYLTLPFDLTKLHLPVILKNTTIDTQVNALANDGLITVTSSVFNNSVDCVVSGYHTTQDGEGDSWYRFTGITIAQSSPVTVAYCSLYEYGSWGTPLTKIWADDQNDPTAIANYADYWARTRTTAGVDYDGDPGATGWHNTPSIVSVIQELVNSYDYSNEAIQILDQNDGGTGQNRRDSRSRDYTGNTYGPKIHIEFSSPVSYTANQTSYAFGTVSPSSTSNTSGNWILFTNTSSVSTNISVQMLASAWTSAGTGWTHSNTAAGVNTAAMKAASGNTTAFQQSVFIKYNSPFNEIAQSVPAGSSYVSGLSLLAPTSLNDGYSNNNTIRFSFYSSS